MLAMHYYSLLYMSCTEESSNKNDYILSYFVLLFCAALYCTLHLLAVVACSSVRCFMCSRSRTHWIHSNLDTIASDASTFAFSTVQYNASEHVTHCMHLESTRGRSLARNARILSNAPNGSDTKLRDVCECMCRRTSTSPPPQLHAHIRRQNKQLELCVACCIGIVSGLLHVHSTTLE